MPSSQLSENLIVDVEDKNIQDMLSKEELDKLMRYQNFQKLKKQQQLKLQRPRMNEEESPNGESLNVQKEETKKKESPEGKKMKLRKIIKKQTLPVTESSDQSEQAGKS
jgi:hypothetical protein